ncbi:MAG: CapA family protein [Bacteroidetes bacterium]|nr:CapA family protein [Bacteroidota bacterium]
MIFGGDIACPTVELSEHLDTVFINNKNVFEGKNKYFNLEGLVADDITTNTVSPIVFNHSSVIKVLNKNKTLGVSLANNHTLDIPQYFNNTQYHLEQNNILFSGAGLSVDEAQKVVELNDEGIEVPIFNYCWDFLLYHQKNPTNGVYISEIFESKIVDDILKYKHNFPNRKLVVYMHWSFDLEILPFPMYRQFSKDLIDIGVTAVIGCHSHCVQGGEKYKNGYIVYGLGNFFFPYNVFVNGSLTFPDFAKKELVFELDFATNKATCHWFDYNNSNQTHELSYIVSETFETSLELKKYSPYMLMTEGEYYNYFKLNRRKKFLIPIYRNYKNVFSNNLYTRYLKMRGRLARSLAKRRLIKWQS